MPSLKDLTCSIELSNPSHSLQEYGTTYKDGCVETFVAVPTEAKPFAVRLTSSAYIAEGLAMYVFIDGVYQCNRNRRSLQNQHSSENPLDRRALVNFLVRQKEEKQKDGEMLAREWTFEKLNIVSADESQKQCSSNIADNKGCIEVVVLRCKGSRTAPLTHLKPAKPQGLGFDGTNDKSNGYFGLEGHPRDWNYDDRTVHPQDSGQRPSSHVDITSGFAYVHPTESSRSRPPSARASSYAASLQYIDNSASTSHRIPMSTPFRPPTTVESPRPHSYRSHSYVAPPVYVHSSDPLRGLYKYGCGPVPHKPRIESQFDLFNGRTPARMSTKEIVDPAFLKQITEEAYRLGLNEAQRELEKEQYNVEINQQVSGSSPASKVPPGAWPPQPYYAPTAPSNITNLSTKKGFSGPPINPWVSSGAPSHTQAPTPTSPHPEHEEIKPRGCNWSCPKDTVSDSWVASTWETSGSSSWKESKQYEDIYSWAKPKPVLPAALTPYGPPLGNLSLGQENGWNGPPHRAGSEWSIPDHVSIHNMGVNSAWDTPATTTSLDASSPMVSPRTLGPSKQQHRSGDCPKEQNHKLGSWWTAVDPSPPLDNQANDGWGSASVRETRSHSSDFWPPSASQAVPRASNTSTTGQSDRLVARNASAKSTAPIPVSLQPQGRRTARSPPPPYSVAIQKLFGGEPHNRNTYHDVSLNPWEAKESTNLQRPTSFSRSKARKRVEAKPKWDSSSHTWTLDHVLPSDHGEQGLGAGDTKSRVMPGSWTYEDNSKNKQAYSGIGADVSSAWDTSQWEDKANDGWLGHNDNSGSIGQTVRAIDWANNGGGDENDNNGGGGLGDHSWGTNKNNADKQDSTTWLEPWGLVAGVNDNKEMNKQNDTSGGGADWGGEWDSGKKDEEVGNDTIGGDAWGVNNISWEIRNKEPKGQQHQNSWDKTRANDDKQATKTAKHSPRSRLHSNYRPHGPHSPGLKPHWAFPPPLPRKKLHPIPEDYEGVNMGGNRKNWFLPEEPLYTIPETKAKKGGLEHQVRAGKGTRYTHAVGRPEYLDTFKNPYAVFRFKYRSPKYLQKSLGNGVPDPEPAPAESAVLLKENLKGVSEAQKVEEIFKLNTKLKESVSTKTPTMVKEWIGDQQERSRNSSRRGASNPSSVQDSKNAWEAASVLAQSVKASEKRFSEKGSEKGSEKRSKKGESNTGNTRAQPTWENGSNSDSKKAVSIKAGSNSGEDGGWGGNAWDIDNKSGGDAGNSDWENNNHSGGDEIWKNEVVGEAAANDWSGGDNVALNW